MLIINNHIGDSAVRAIVARGVAAEAPVGVCNTRMSITFVITGFHNYHDKNQMLQLHWNIYGCDEKNELYILAKHNVRHNALLIFIKAYKYSLYKNELFWKSTM